ncbi:MAG TPA: hypothetical protein VLJ57_23735 [Burkholderiaceae bacterium]|nr:hypothetical protein [Burkholderiaceae bacterium]
MSERKRSAHPQRAPSIAVPRRHLLLAALGAGLALGLAQPRARAAGAGQPQAPLKLTFRGVGFMHRWSNQGQHEFTPQGEDDLAAWRNMVTLNVHASVVRGEQLAEVANQVLGNYQRHGKILQTRSQPRTAERPAEHLIVAVLGNPQLLEAVFARCLLHEGLGFVVVVSHRVYGKAAGPEMSDWLKANGPAVEQALMNWALPGAASVKGLRTPA